MTPAQILAIIKLLQDIITPEVWLQISKYFAETGNMPSEDKILEMHGDAHPPEWYDTKAHKQQLNIESFTCPEPPKPTPVVTYKIASDQDGQLKIAGKISCNFWNHFITPSHSVVVRLGTFYSNGYVIARSYLPYGVDGVTYGVVEFNTKYLSQFTPKEIAIIVIHEIGHTLGFGWERWMGLFDRITGRFHDLDMYAELDYGPGTQYSHWDEQRYSAELMTGIQGPGAEYLKSETIKVMSMLGHSISVLPVTDVPMSQILSNVEQIQFTRQGDVERIDLEHFEKTELMEEHYMRGRV